VEFVCSFRVADNCGDAVLFEFENVVEELTADEASGTYKD
jgi:hypothetical protein